MLFYVNIHAETSPNVIMLQKASMYETDYCCPNTFGRLVYIYIYYIQ